MSSLSHILLSTRIMSSLSVFSAYKNNAFTRLNSKDHQTILKTYCFLKQVVVFHSCTWLFTPNILTLQATSEPVLILSMYSGSFTNGSFACHASQTLGIRWMQMSIITPTKVVIPLNKETKPRNQIPSKQRHLTKVNRHLYKNKKQICHWERLRKELI